MKNKDMQTSYLTTGEASLILRVTPRTVYEWLRTGKLKGRKMGKKGSTASWRIPADVVIAKKEEK